MRCSCHVIIISSYSPSIFLGTSIYYSSLLNSISRNEAFSHLRFNPGASFKFPAPCGERLCYREMLGTRIERCRTNFACQSRWFLYYAILVRYSFLIKRRVLIYDSVRTSWPLFLTRFSTTVSIPVSKQMFSLIWKERGRGKYFLWSSPLLFLCEWSTTTPAFLYLNSHHWDAKPFRTMMPVITGWYFCFASFPILVRSTGNYFFSWVGQENNRTSVMKGQVTCEPSLTLVRCILQSTKTLPIGLLASQCRYVC